VGVVLWFICGLGAGAGGLGSGWYVSSLAPAP
jgi:hypothetical protein